MAEQALYDNNDEPPFPFEEIRGRLSWLLAYLNNHISYPSYDLAPLLNTVLVFGRARTSTLQDRRQWNEVHALTKDLNSALESIGALHHRIELVLRGRHSFFVTCSHSPRFNWKLALTHYDVGRNLDYFAPGHNTAGTKCSVHFVEMETLQTIMSEAVSLDHLKHDAVQNEFQKFNERRESLFNSTMEQLGLRYRFKCIVGSPGVLDNIPRAMASPFPPSASWWEDNCFHVNGFYFPNIVMDSKYAFCGYNPQYVAYWPLMRLAFDFMMKYKRNEFLYTSEETGVEYWKSMERICHRDASDIIVLMIDIFFGEIEGEFVIL